MVGYRIIRETLGTDYGDANLDGVVDLLDYNLWENGYGSSGGWSAGDFNGDGMVDAADFIFWRDASEAAATAIPEPAAGVMVLLLVLCFSPMSPRLVRNSSN